MSTVSMSIRPFSCAIGMRNAIYADQAGLPTHVGPKLALTVAQALAIAGVIMNVLSTLVIAGRTASAIADPTSVALANASATVVEITDLLILILLAKKPLQNAFLKCCWVK